MLDYAKVILPKVSFSEQLFKKELIKCINWLEPSEVKKLREWCFLTFKEIYPDLLKEVFSSVAA
ncbi:MAG: hypothetical protein GX820_04670 [Bacteroidales bacterium]|jgi:hypothetical protein|nr:hypothetical protein [Bacteroidales bacterium]